MNSNFIHAKYVSTADIVFCATFDIEAENADPQFDEMRTLHEALPTDFLLDD